MDNYKKAVHRAQAITGVTMCVGDMSETYYDLEHADELKEVVEACEATDSPVITFYQNGKSMGYMLVSVGEGDESIVDYGINEFMEDLVEDLY